MRVKIRNLKFWISRTFLYFSAELFWRQKFKYLTNYSKKSDEWVEWLVQNWKSTGNSNFWNLFSEYLYFLHFLCFNNEFFVDFFWFTSQGWWDRWNEWIFGDWKWIAEEPVFISKRLCNSLTGLITGQKNT